MIRKLIVFTAAAAFAAAWTPLTAADAKASYDKMCASCHGKDGKGDTAMGKKLKAKDYTDAKVQAELKDEDILKAIKDGVPNSKMKGYADKLSEQEIKDQAALVRSFKK